MHFLPQIESPADLKKFTRSELKIIARELRQMIIETVSRTGGHLASSLGAVELTLALHYVFDSPRDKIVWDVGHQAYAHKILTGRRDRFATNRQLGGISGFVRYGESEHDIVTVGHSSTSISAALGLAVARDLLGEQFHVIAVIGDGAMTGGMAFEALNNAGAMKKDLLVILNDNSMSISKNVGALAEYLTRLMTRPFYVRLKNHIWDTAGNFPEVGRHIRKAGKMLDDGIKSITPGLLFEELGFDYFGPIDGHNLDLLINILTRMKSIRGPLLLHVLTQKGRGFEPAEKDATTFHGVGKFQLVNDEVISSRSGITYTEIFSRTIVQLAEKEPRLVAVTAAMETGTGLDEFHRRFPERFFDVGIAEQHAVTFAANMARMGLKPVVAIYSTFLQRAYDQIIHDVAIDNLPVIFAIDRGGLVGEDGPTHHGVFDLSYLRIIPNMTIMAPGDGQEFVQMLHTAVQYTKGPVAIRYPRASLPAEPDYSVTEPVPIGKGIAVLQGEHLVILAIGSMVSLAKEVAEAYHEETGRTPTVINLRFLKPLDHELLFSVFSTHRFAVTLEENTVRGGLGSAISEWLHEHIPMHIPVLHLGIPDEFITHGRRDELLQTVGLISTSCLQSILHWETHLTTQKGNTSYETIRIR